MPLCECVCECVCECDNITNRKECVYSLQSEEDTNHANDALTCRPLSAKEPLIIVAINRGVSEQSPIDRLPYFNPPHYSGPGGVFCGK